MSYHQLHYNAQYSFVNGFAHFFKKIFRYLCGNFFGIRTNAISPPTQYIYNIPKAPIYSDLNTSFRPPRQDAAKKAAARYIEEE